MKTTVDLADDLLIMAKKVAAEQRRPLREIIEDGIRSYLKERKTSRASKHHKKKIPWTKIVSQGGLPTELNISDRDAMYSWLDKS